ncbi:MAG: ferritin [Butyrivibrio sp.]|nr:ferritin [Butyrivibrio sp.]
MNEKVVELLNAQVNKEFFSAYMYLGVSQYYTRQNLPGFASWYMIQAQEEQEHAMKFYNYLVDNDVLVELSQIIPATSDYKDPLAAAKAADKHEHYITAEIEKIMDAAVKDKDYRTQLFLNWFITEQEEEERNSKDMIAKIEMIGNDNKGLYMLDKELGERKG